MLEQKSSNNHEVEAWKYEIPKRVRLFLLFSFFLLFCLVEERKGGARWLLSMGCGLVQSNLLGIQLRRPTPMVVYFTPSLAINTIQRYKHVVPTRSSWGAEKRRSQALCRFFNVFKYLNAFLAIHSALVAPRESFAEESAKGAPNKLEEKRKTLFAVLSHSLIQLAFFIIKQNFSCSCLSSCVRCFYDKPLRR